MQWSVPGTGVDEPTAVGAERRRRRAGGAYPLRRLRARAARGWRRRTTRAPCIAWSVAEPAAFWSSVWDFCGVVAAAKGDTVRTRVGCRGRAGSREPASTSPRTSSGVATTAPPSSSGARSPPRTPTASTTGSSPGAGSTTTSRAPRRGSGRPGVGPGDRVAGYLPNLPETVIAMLAATSLGAVWSSCSPDFGVQGVLDRFGQTRAQGPGGRGRLPLQRRSHRLARADPRGPRRRPERRAHRHRAVPPPRTRPPVPAGRDCLGRADPRPPRARHRVRAGRLRPPALHPCTRRAPPAPRSASSTAPAGPSSSTSRSTASTRTSAPATTPSSTSPPAGG